MFLPSGAREKRPTNLSIRGDLVAAARAAEVNLSELLERAIVEELRALRWRAWRRDNAATIDAYNGHVQKHGVLRDPRECP